MAHKQKNTYLYHYTTPEGLIGIVEKKNKEDERNIWATEIFYLNDSGEFLAGMKIAIEHLEKLFRNANVRKDNLMAKRLEWLLKEMKPIGSLRSLRIYVCSFSTDGDELSQWRAYCPRGGFAIGFPASRLRTLAKKQEFVLKKCVYNPDTQTKMVNNLVDEVVQKKLSPQEVLLAGPNAESVIRCTLSGQLTWELARVYPVLKNAAFKSEKEWRLISEPRSALYIATEMDSFSFRHSIIGIILVLFIVQGFW